MDVTYKLNDLRMPLYLFLIEHRNGESEIVSVWMVVTEDTVKWPTCSRSTIIDGPAQPQSWLTEILLKEML